MTAATVAAPKRRRTRVVLVGLLAAVAVGFAVTLLVRRELAERRLAAVIAELDRTDPGWRLDDVERARSVVPDAENSATVIDAVVGSLVRPQRGLAEIVGGIENGLTPNVRLTPEQAADLRDVLKPNANLVPDVLVLAERPQGRYVLGHAPDGVSTLLSHVDRMTKVNSHVLDPLHYLAVQDGDVPRAVAVLRARLNLSRSMRDEPYLISQTVRSGHFRNRSIRDLERLLGHATPTADQLATVRRELDAELADDPWLVAIRGQRAMADRAMAALRSGALKASFLKMISQQGGNRTPTERVGDWINDHVAIEVTPAHAAALELLTRTAATSALPWHERLPAVKALDAEWAAAPEPARWLGGPRTTQWLYALVLGQARLRCAVAAVAVEQYRVRHGDWPTSLAALGEPLPDDPFTGKPLLYKRTADGVVIDAAVTGPGGAGATGDGVAVRLWDMAKRNRPPGGAP